MRWASVLGRSARVCTYSSLVAALGPVPGRRPPLRGVVLGPGPPEQVGHRRAEQLAGRPGLVAVVGQEAVEHDDVGGELGHALTLGVERGLGRRDQQAEDQGGHGRDDAHGQLDHVLRVGAEVVFGEAGAQQHAEEGARGAAGEDDPADRDRAHDPGPLVARSGRPCARAGSVPMATPASRRRESRGRRRSSPGGYGRIARDRSDYRRTGVHRHEPTGHPACGRRAPSRNRSVLAGDNSLSIRLGVAVSKTTRNGMVEPGSVTGLDSAAIPSRFRSRNQSPEAGRLPRVLGRQVSPRLSDVLCPAATGRPKGSQGPAHGAGRADAARPGRRAGHLAIDRRRNRARLPALPHSRWRRSASDPDRP